MGPRRALLFSACVLAAVTAGAQNDAGDDQPRWLQQHMQREASRLKPKKVRFDKMRSRLPGEISIGPAYSDGTWHVGTDIGGDYPVVCFVHEQEMNLANTVAAQAAFDVASVSDEMGAAVTVRESTAIDAGAIDGSPYLGMEYQYRIGEGEDARIGLIKVWGTSRKGATLVCKHNEIGFRKSVFGLFESFVDGFENRDAPPRPYYGATLVTTADGQPVGVTTIRFTRDDDGYTKIETNRSTLRATADDAVIATDRYDLMWSEPGGDLLNAYSTSTTDGIEDHSLTLSYEDDTWTVHGTLGSDDVAQALEDGPRPMTPLGWYRLIRTTMNGDASETVSFRTWLPGAAPQALVDATFARQGDTGGLLDLGPLSTRIEVDEDGYIRAATTAGDDTELVHTRVWRVGKID